MKRPILLLTALASLATASFAAAPTPSDRAPEPDSSLAIKRSQVRVAENLGVIVFELQLDGTAGSIVPTPRGQVDTAPVLAYVFPTSLRPEQVGFASSDGIVALAITSHPDFDDTPLWDENRDFDYGNDGAVYHTHWVVLVEDERVAGGLSVKSAAGLELDRVLPPTHPGMPIFLDSPGHSVVLDRSTLRVVVPVEKIRGSLTFSYDAVTAYLEVNRSDPDRPTLGVYRVYSVQSGDLSLPYRVKPR